MVKITRICGVFEFAKPMDREEVHFFEVQTLPHSLDVV